MQAEVSRDTVDEVKIHTAVYSALRAHTLHDDILTLSGLDSP